MLMIETSTSKTNNSKENTIMNGSDLGELNLEEQEFYNSIQVLLDKLYKDPDLDTVKKVKNFSNKY